MIKASIRDIYHSHGGVDGYRTMQVYLRRKGTYISCATVHKYMKKMQLFSVSRRKKPGYVHGAAHKVYDNRLKQNFHAKKRNRKWCTDFTYLTLADGRKRYNCTIIDLYDRSVIASITDRNITSDQGSQYTSREFTEFCIEKGITQSMSKAGYPYDNAPMERYFNTLKTEFLRNMRYRIFLY